MIRKIAAAVGISAALALGASGVAFADAPPVAQISAVANADCTYTVTASVTGNTTGYGVEVGEDGSVVLSDTNPNADYGGPVPLSQLDPSDIWSTTTATSSDWFRVMLYVNPGTGYVATSGTVSLWLSGYQCVVATPTPVAATAPPTDTPAPTATSSGDTGNGYTAPQGQSQGTTPSTAPASPTDTPAATATAAPTDTPSATAQPSSAPTAVGVTPPSSGGGLAGWALALIIVGPMVFAGSALGAFLRRQRTA